MFKPTILKRAVEECKNEFEHVKMYGVPIIELTKEELMAGLIILRKQKEDERKFLRKIISSI